jgi:hypothetical protein
MNSPRVLQASLVINNTGANQTSAIVAALGLVSGTTPGLVGGLRGTSLLSANGSPILISSGFGSLADGVGGGLYGSSGLSGIALGATSPFAAETPLGGTPTVYNFNQPAVISTTPTGVGPGLGTNPSASFIPNTGFFAGQMNSTAATPYPITGSVNFLQTGPTTFTANFASDTISESSGTLSRLNLTFGGSPGTSQNSTIIDGNIYGATEGLGGTLTDNSSNSYPATQQLYLLSSAAAPPPSSLLLSGGTLCSACQFTQWGYWGGQANSDFGGNPRTELGHLNFWVAGQPTNVATLPTGSGTYNGNMIGSVNNSGAQYIATGAFRLNYDFGTNQGTFKINSFDSFSNLTAPISGGGGTFSGASSGSPGLSVKGAFFGPGAPEAAGNFKLNASAYLATGIFAGHNP